MSESFVAARKGRSYEAPLRGLTNVTNVIPALKGWSYGRPSAATSERQKVRGYLRSSVRTTRDSKPVVVLGREIDQEDLTVTVEATAHFDNDEAAAAFAAAVRDLLEKV